jgi:hypothetical protein
MVSRHAWLIAVKCDLDVQDVQGHLTEFAVLGLLGSKTCLNHPLFLPAHQRWRNE